MPAPIEAPRGYALQLREAFLGTSAKLLPGVVWRHLSICELEHPSPSPVFGPLTVEFESDQITLYCVRHHLHFPHYGGDIQAGARKAAADALNFIRDLTSDAIVVRWGPYGSWTVRASRSSGVLWRWWRRIDPRVREAVWSGRTGR